MWTWRDACGKGVTGGGDGAVRPLLFTCRKLPRSAKTWWRRTSRSPSPLLQNVAFSTGAAGAHSDIRCLNSMTSRLRDHYHTCYSPLLHLLPNYTRLSHPPASHSISLPPRVLLAACSVRMSVPAARRLQLGAFTRPQLNACRMMRVGSLRCVAPEGGRGWRALPGVCGYGWNPTRQALC